MVHYFKIYAGVFQRLESSPDKGVVVCSNHTISTRGFPTPICKETSGQDFVDYPLPVNNWIARIGTRLYTTIGR